MRQPRGPTRHTRARAREGIRPGPVFVFVARPPPLRRVIRLHPPESARPMEPIGAAGDPIGSNVIQSGSSRAISARPAHSRRRARAGLGIMTPAPALRPARARPSPIRPPRASPPHASRRACEPTPCEPAPRRPLSRPSFAPGGCPGGREKRDESPLSTPRSGRFKPGRQLASVRRGALRD